MKKIVAGLIFAGVVGISGTALAAQARPKNDEMFDAIGVKVNITRPGQKIATVPQKPNIQGINRPPEPPRGKRPPMSNDRRPPKPRSGDRKPPEFDSLPNRSRPPRPNGK